MGWWWAVAGEDDHRDLRGTCRSFAATSSQIDSFNFFNRRFSRIIEVLCEDCWSFAIPEPIGYHPRPDARRDSASVSNTTVTPTCLFIGGRRAKALLVQFLPARVQLTRSRARPPGDAASTTSVSWHVGVVYSTVHPTGGAPAKDDTRVFLRWA